MNADLQNAVRSAARRLAETLPAIDSHPVDTEAAYSQVAAAIDRCLAELNRLGLWGPDNRLPSSELWNVAGPWLSRGWLPNRARTKPRGYAGDYEMLARIYEQRLCDDPLGRLMDRYFQVSAAPQAVCNRMRMMRDWIGAALAARVEQPLRVGIVGSAFGSEVRDALLDHPAHEDRNRLHAVLLDLDPAAIEFAHAQLAPLLPADRLTAAAANLFRLAERPRLAAPLAGCDWIFCPGLFDYLDDAAAAAMLQCLFAQLAPGGRLTVFQFAPHNPTRSYMEWIGNWYLLYRDAAQFRELVSAAGFTAQQAHFAAEPLGVDLYVELTRPE